MNPCCQLFSWLNICGKAIDENSFQSLDKKLLMTFIKRVERHFEMEKEGDQVGKMERERQRERGHSETQTESDTHIQTDGQRGTPIVVVLFQTSFL